MQIYEARILDANGKVKKTISAKKLRKKFWKDYERNKLKRAVSGKGFTMFDRPENPLSEFHQGNDAIE